MEGDDPATDRVRLDAAARSFNFGQLWHQVAGYQQKGPAMPGP
jgi:hypothetical protein